MLFELLEELLLLLLLLLLPLVLASLLLLPPPPLPPPNAAAREASLLGADSLRCPTDTPIGARARRAASLTFWHRASSVASGVRTRTVLFLLATAEPPPRARKRAAERAKRTLLSMYWSEEPE